MAAAPSARLRLPQAQAPCAALPRVTLRVAAPPLPPARLPLPPRLRRHLPRETCVLFCVEHLERLVRLGRWLEAIWYVTRFVLSAGTHQLGDAGWVFIEFLHMHAALDCIVAGKPHGAAVAEEYGRYINKYPDSCYPGTIKLGRILLAMLHSHPLRASVNWHLVRLEAAEIIKDLIAQIPEFNDLLKLPICPTKPHDILPIGSSYKLSALKH
ncbi:hypothetical protein E2562_016871 [Oryza meyeriana var. granulata]|uniref:Uncharacterized protein n=1 Tax=Oryza meyeriana var. granulata TaxID=110450 RepID=A0A6G1BW43_9ORYZ|nr:hypothetical protein E2562_016871 [Oryza meyeriana var. granulata]